MDRRAFLRAGAGAVLTAGLADCSREPAWDPAARRKAPRSRIAVLREDGYRGDLEDLVARGLAAFDLDLRDRRVVLKPNFVEFDPEGVINTHPALLAGAITAFRRLGAREVVVAEGPGHRRDNEYLLSASGIGDVLSTTGAPFVDLNNDAVRRVRLKSRFTGLGSLYLPITVLGADLFVSMPKLKTHHWAGVTLSMKNLFGIVPGAIYGWPKNLLHWVGIAESILDINAALDVPRFNIVDGIVGMEGNGPIQGEAVASGVVVMGADPVAVDATCARLMGLEPARIGYIEDASRFLGNAAAELLDQLAEDPAPLRRDFRVVEAFERTRATPRMTGG